MRKTGQISVNNFVPKEIEMGFCAISQNNSYDFILQNPKRDQISFRFDSSKFKITPQSGVIEPKQQLKLQIQWVPVEAEVIVSTAILYISNEEPITIKISGIGKYPYLELNQTKIDFDTLLVGKKLSKTLILKNQSKVKANFTINQIQDQDFQDNIFQVEQNRGVLAPNQSFQIVMVYSPSICHLTNVQHFEINVEGGNRIKFQCVGKAIPFDVNLSTNSINYQEVKLGQMISRMFTINNPQDLQAKFQFFNQPGNVFSFSKTKGIIAAKSNIRIIVYFNPTYPVSYYSRVYCLVRNHQILYLDLIGSGYDLLMRPLPLNQTHIDLFRSRVIDGRLNKLDFKYLENSLVNGPLYSTYKESTKMRKETLYSESETALHKELLQSIKSQNKLLNLSEDTLDFNFQPFMQTSASREVILTNKLPISLQIFWTLQYDDVNDEEQKSVIFNVHPNQAVIKGNSELTFEISFKPTKNSFYFFQNLQFFAVKIDSRSTKQIIDKSRTYSHFMPKQTSMKNQPIMDEMVPSVEGSLFCIGHSFPEGTQPFIPIMQIKPSNQVYFKPCSLGQSVYQTFEFVNQTDTPAYFKFNADIDPAIKIFPKQGVVEAKSFSLILVEFSPTQEGVFRKTITASLNHSASNQAVITCNGHCCSPDLQIANQGKVYFPPSFIGVVSKQSINIKNISKIECEFVIQVPESYKDEVFINPTNGTLKAHESKSLEFNFIPLKKKKYKINVPVILKQIQSELVYGFFKPGSYHNTINQQCKQIENKFEIIGQGSDGDLTFNAECINFEDVKINFNKKVYFTLKNQSNCMFNVQLILKSNEKKQQQLSSWFDLDFQEGIVAANSQVEIGITFSPTEVCDLNVELICYTKERSGKGAYTQNNQEFNVQKCKMRVKAKGSYPLLKIVDVRNDSISVATLWENMQINQINKQLSNNLNEDEKKYLIIETLNYQEANGLMKNLQTYQWNFGCLPATQNIKPRTIIITIQNVGGTDLDWNFKLPSDSQIDVEPWADPGEPTEDEAFEKFIIEKKIFEIYPKRGFLRQGELADIQIIYNPQNQEDGNSEAVKHHLQVVLEILNGKPVVIQLKGMTVALMKGMITLRKTHYTLPDVPIGLLMPLTFPIEINNVGSANVSYRIQIIQIDNNNNSLQNKHFKIFDIKNQNGSLNPGEKQYLYCLLRPLEQKLYQFKCIIQVFDHQNQIDNIEINVQYRGYFKNVQQKLCNNESLPSQRSQVSTIGSKVFFSMEEIDFGDVNVNDSEFRILILYNLSKTHKLTFSFKNTGLVCGDELILEPIQGSILPDQFIEIKLTLIPNILPSIYEGEIECKIQWDNDQQTNINNDETLFLRIKKKSQLKNMKNDNFQLYENNQDDDNSPINHIFSNIIQDVLNSQEVQDVVDTFHEQDLQLFAQIADEDEDNQALNSKELEQYRPELTNNKNRQCLFQNTEFVELIDHVFENTFYNLIQETTRKEANLLKVSKTFISSNR